VQVSVVQEIPSSQVETVEQTPAALHWPQPAGLLSLQVVPVRGVQAVVLLAGVQIWQGFEGFTVPLA
jgi:hypothetical protein